MDGYARRTPASERTTFRVGYFARIAPEKGLHVLAEAYVRFRQRAGDGAAPRRSPATWRRTIGAISRGARRAEAGRARRRVHLSRRARSRRASSRSCAASTCCRCRRPTTSRKACFCSRRWPRRVPSCSRGAARSSRSSRRPAAACSSNRTIRTRSRTVFTRCGRIARCARRLRTRVRGRARALHDRAVGGSSDRGLRRRRVSSREVQV